MVDENILIMFVTHCATSLELSYSTIKQYLNGIRYHCVKLAGFNPLLTDAGVTLNKLQLVMRGIRKTEVEFNRQVHMPVTSFVLGRLINLLNGAWVWGVWSVHGQPHESCLFSSFLRIPSLW